MPFKVEPFVNNRILNIANGTTITVEEIPFNDVVALSVTVPTGLDGPLFLVAKNETGTFDPVVYQNDYIVFDNTLIASAARRWVIDFPLFGVGTPMKLLVGTTLTDPTPLAGTQTPALTLALYITRKAGM